MHPSGASSCCTIGDHDGRMDDRTVFLDALVLPRAVLPLRGGALVIEPPNLYWCPDRDGDLQADGKELVMGGFEAGLENPEHSGNGLLWGLDGCIHLANDKRMLRWSPKGFAIENGSGGGQWGHHPGRPRSLLLQLQRRLAAYGSRAGSLRTGRGGRGWVAGAQPSVAAGHLGLAQPHLAWRQPWLPGGAVARLRARQPHRRLWASHLPRRSAGRL
jgi:hypothetical protein